MSGLCEEGMCQGPEQCWLQAYLETPAPTPPDMIPDDVNAARRMKRCPVRNTLRSNFSEVFEQAEHLNP